MNHRSPHALELPAIIYPLPSILDRLALHDLFPREQPLHVELGSGDGSFLVNYAQAHPEQNFIGLERLLGRIRKLERKARRAGLQNLRGIRIESSYFLKYLLPPHSAAALHIYFPDPWPKRKHRRHRLINQTFPDLARAALRSGGFVYLRTDDQDYFRQMAEVFAQSPEFLPVDTPPELAEVLTDFERAFHQQGVKTLQLGFQLVCESAD